MNWKNVSLRGANLTGAMMDFSNLENVDLSGALTDKPMGQTVDMQDVPLEEKSSCTKSGLKRRAKMDSA